MYTFLHAYVYIIFICMYIVNRDPAGKHCLLAGWKCTVSVGPKCLRPSPSAANQCRCTRQRPRNLHSTASARFRRSTCNGYGCGHGNSGCAASCWLIWVPRETPPSSASLCEDSRHVTQSPAGRRCSRRRCPPYLITHTHCPGPQKAKSTAGRVRCVWCVCITKACHLHGTVREAAEDARAFRIPFHSQAPARIGT